MGSVKSGVEGGGDGGTSVSGSIPSSVDGASASGVGVGINKQQPRMSNASNMKPARHSAKELPVWLISMFLLVHCEDQAFLRCTSADDERRFSNDGGGGSISPSPRSHHYSRPGEAETDFNSMLLHRSLSLRTRLHAGVHQNNAHCASFLLRHLRKFLLLCAVPRNSEACRAIAALAAQHQKSEDRSLKTVLSATMEELDVAQIEQKHKDEHRNIGLNVQLTLEELDRLSLVLQAPSGGPVEEPPIAIGEHVLKCLAVEEMEARESSGGRSSSASLHRMSLIHNGLVTVGDAERILRKYLEDELATAQQELEGDDNENSEDVANKLSRMTLNNQPLSPPRSRGFSVAESVATTDANTVNDSSSYFKELSYRKLRSTTVLLEPNRDYTGFTSNANNTDTQSVVSLHSQTSSTHYHSTQQDKLQSDSNESGRLHDLHIADCSDTHFYLLQPFEHATIAACSDCTIVVGAVAGLLHIVVS
jgi:TBCC domain-containing protein 1